jgi:cholesterol transport system auxiliary component
MSLNGTAAQSLCGRATVWLLLAGGLLSGCLSRPGLVSKSFTFATPNTRVAETNAGPILAVRKLTIAAPFAVQSFVYRTGASSYEQDPYAQFLVPPDESLSEPVRAYFRNTGLFRAVTEPGSSVQPDMQVEIFVPELYGDFRNRHAPAAILSMRFVFLRAARRSSARVFAERTFSRRVPLKARTAAALMDGWNEALKDIMAQVASTPLSTGAQK